MNANIQVSLDKLTFAAIAFLTVFSAHWSANHNKSRCDGSC
jgi:hypothetical protein